MTAALAIVALLLALSTDEPRVLAHAPHVGIDFSMEVDTDGDTVDDCGTSVGDSTTCPAPLNGPFRAREFLNSPRGHDVLQMQQ